MRPAPAVSLLAACRIALCILGLILTALPALALDSPLPKPMEHGQSELWGYADASGAFIIAPEYLVAMPFLESGIAAVATEEAWLWIDTQGNTLAQAFIHDNGPDDFSENRTRIIRDGKMGFMDETGSIVIEAAWDFAGPFSSGLAIVCSGCERVYSGEHYTMQNGEWGCIDHTGALAEPLTMEPPACSR